jgi:hypothetical protein
MSMANIIWKINLFNRLPDIKVECIEGKSASKGNYEFRISDGSVKSLIVHFQGNSQPKRTTNDEEIEETCSDQKSDP